MRTLPSATRVVVVAAFALVVGACGSSSESPPTPVVDVTPASVVANASPPATSAAGAALAAPVAVKVSNRAGATVSGAVVTFRVVAGGGAVNPSTASTDAQGIATTSWTLGPIAGAQSLSASVGDLTPVTFSTTAVAAAAAAVAKFAGDAQTASAGTSVAIAPSVRVVDAAGNPVIDASVTFTVTGGGGSVSAATPRTDANGVARVGAWVLGAKAGANTLQASVGSVPSASFTAAGIPGAPTTLTFARSLPARMLLGDTVDLSPTLADVFGNQNTTAATTYVVTPAGAARVDAGRFITQTAGSISVRATAGGASATTSTSVVGHPVGPAVLYSFDAGAEPDAIAVTDEAIWTLNTTGYPRQLVRRSYEGLPLASVVPIENISTNYLVLAPKTTGKTVIVASRGAVSTSYWFVDIATNAKIDSLTTQRYLQLGEMNADGSRAYLLLDAGELAVFDVARRQFLASIPLGGGVLTFKIAQGDSLAFATTNLGTMMEIDLKRGVVRRQYAMRYTNFDVSPDATKFYVLDVPERQLRVLRTSDREETTAFLAIHSGMVAVAPDDRALFITGGLATYIGSPATGYTPGVRYSSAGVVTRMIFTTDGSALVLVKSNGTVDVIR